MAGEEEEFQLCPNCKVGRLRPTGLAATSSDPQTNRVTNDLRGYKCDSCGHPEGGQAKVVAANEQAVISESTNITTTSSPAATTAAVQSAVEAVGAVVEEDNNAGKEGTEEEVSYNTTGSSSGSNVNENPT